MVKCTLNHVVFMCNGGHRSTVVRNIALLLSVIDFIIFFAQILLTCDPKVTNASVRESVRGTLQRILYRRGRKGVGAKDGVQGLDYVWRIIYDLFSC